MGRASVTQGRLTPRLGAWSVVAVTLATLSSCKEAPTEVIVDVYYEGVHCRNTAAIAAGPVGKLGDRPASATSNTCDEATGSMGRLVVTPRDDEDAEFGVEVRVRPDQGDPETCVAANNYEGCIVARRLVSYLPGRSVTMRVDLRNPCVDTPCDEETTCIAQGLTKACSSAHLDLSKCSGDCGEKEVIEQSEEGFSPCAEGSNPCDENGRCVSRDGEEPTCRCNTGYTNDKKDANKCIDVDECGTLKHECDAHADCENTEGSYTCECYAGYEGDGFTCEQSACADTCGKNATCKFASGSYQCVCDDGYLGDGQSCADLDECNLGLDDCPGTSKCTNTRGAFTCSCPEGYELKETGCKDIDECKLGLDDCPGNTICTNTAGTFTCGCLDGYELTDSSCKDIDECTLGLDDCPGDSTCENTGGAFTCNCAEGYEYKESACKDIDECAPEPCQNGGTCSHGIGFYVCSCADGFGGDNCEEVCPAGFTGPNCTIKLCGSDAQCDGAVGACVDGECQTTLTLWSQGTATWPDQACNPTNTFGNCTTNDQSHADAWATSVCVANGWTSGVWTGNKMGGCGNNPEDGWPSVSMYCQNQIPCAQMWESACNKGDQTIVEFTCLK